MNKAPPYTIGDIVRLDSQGLPIQVWRTDEFSIGPAFKTEPEAIEADKLRHTAQVFIHDVDGKVMLTWWEASQSGLPERLGHTEQKALLRMWLRRGLYVLIQGTHPCCPYGTGCLNAMADLAELHDCVFDYRAARGNAIYHFERVGRRSAVREL
jgi:hypothetical protein